MALAKSTPTSLGSVSNIAASSSWSSSYFDVSDAIACEIEAVFTFSIAPTSGNITIQLYASQDGTNSSDEPIFTYSTEDITSTNYRVVFGADIVPHKNILVYITNNTNQAVNVSINAIKTVI